MVLMTCLVWKQTDTLTNGLPHLLDNSQSSQADIMINQQTAQMTSNIDEDRH